MPRRTEIKFQEEQITGISGDRRESSRYFAELPLRYRIIGGGVATSAGRTHSLDLSKGGVAFATAEVLPVGTRVEVAIEWPCKGTDREVELVYSGRVVRSDSQITAIGHAQREFRLVDASWVKAAC